MLRDEEQIVVPVTKMNWRDLWNIDILQLTWMYELVAFTEINEASISPTWPPARCLKYDSLIFIVRITASFTTWL